MSRLKNKPNRWVLALLAFGFLYVGRSGLPANAAPVSLPFQEKIIGGGQIDFNSQINTSCFNAGDTIEVEIDFNIHSPAVKNMLLSLNGIYILLRAERIFDAQGRYHQFTNNYASCVLTPTGLPIENYDLSCDYAKAHLVEYTDGLQPHNRFFGRSNATPLYSYAFIKKDLLKLDDNTVSGRCRIKALIDNTCPEGYYRFQILTLVKRGRNFYRVNVLPLYSDKSVPYSDWDIAILSRTTSYLPVIKIGRPKTPRMVWTLFTQDYSNGTQGVVANEDRDYFQFNSRHCVPAKFILPPPNQSTEPIRYNLEPDFPTMFAKELVKLELGANWDFQQPIPLNFKQGELTVSVTNPDNSVTDLGVARFQAASSTGATTNMDQFKYTFNQYGKYIIQMRGWIEDVWGNKYTGGGIYEVWMAHRLTFATSVKPGTPFEVGESYPPSVIVHPPCPADISVDVKLYRDSDKSDLKHVVVSGIANRFGYFYPRQKCEIMRFDAPGEYISEISATYIDKQERLWMGEQRSGSVVAPLDSPLIVHGASPAKHNMGYIDKRGNTHYEGRFLITDKVNNGPVDNSYTCCTLYPFPYYSGDILYVANSVGGDNGFVPQLTMRSNNLELFGTKQPVDLDSTTTNEYQPQGYPEFLKTQSYGYMCAIRAGFSARYLVAENTKLMFDAYWQSGANFAGLQINNSYNGDLPQDVYEFFGGVVYRNLLAGKNYYGIYASMGVVIPKGSFANRVSAPLSEPIFEVNGRKHYLFDAGAPLPGLVLEKGDVLRASGMIFPPVGGIKCAKIITTPSGGKYVFKGITNKIGLAKMVTPEGGDIIITEPGVYEVRAECRFKGKKGDIVGSGDGKYYVYAVDPQDTSLYFDLDLPANFTVRNNQVLEIRGNISGEIKNAAIYYTIIMPGLIMDEGEVEVINNRFVYRFSPGDIAIQFPNYDLVDYRNPTAQSMADNVIFTFFLSATNNAGQQVCSVKRFLLRGDKGVLLN